MSHTDSLCQCENCESGSNSVKTDTVFLLLNVAMPSPFRLMRDLASLYKSKYSEGGISHRDGRRTGVSGPQKSSSRRHHPLMFDHGYSLFSLPAVDTPDPYVTLSIPSAPDGRRQTRAIKDNKDPEWNQTFEFVIDPELNNNLSTYD